MSTKGPKSPKPKKLQQKAKGKKSPLSPLAILIGLCTLLGGPAAVATFWPRLAVNASDPVDASQPFSSSVTVANSGVLTLDSVHILVGLEHIENGSRSLRAETPDKARFERSDYPPRDLARDEKFTFSLSDFFSFSHPPQLDSAAVSVAVRYKIPIIHIESENSSIS